MTHLKEKKKKLTKKFLQVKLNYSNGLLTPKPTYVFSALKTILRNGVKGCSINNTAWKTYMLSSYNIHSLHYLIQHLLLLKVVQFS